MNTNTEATKHDLELSRQDFYARYEDGSYHYPYPSEVYKDPIIHESPYFNTSSLESALQLPVLEVGGPTTSGFPSIDGMSMKYPPVMTDVFKLKVSWKDSEKKVTPSKSLDPIDKLVLNAIADVRKLPFAPSSIGVILAAHLPKTGYDYLHPNEEVEARVRELGMPLERDFLKEPEFFHHFRPVVEEWYDKQSKSFMQRIKSGESLAELAQSPEAEVNPRMALQITAMNTLADGGFLIMRGVLPADIERGDALGLTVQRIQYDASNLDPNNPVYDEVIFQKSPDHSTSHN